MGLELAVILPFINYPRRHRYSGSDLMQYTELQWREGLPYSERFDDIYYSDDDSTGHNEGAGEGEFRHVFLAGNKLPQRWRQTGDFVIAELGFGSGLNCMLTIQEWLRHLSECRHKKTLHYIAVEKYPLSPQAVSDLLRIRELEPVCRELLADYPPPVETVHCRRLFDGRVVVHFRFMDVLDALDTQGLQVDSWYLDGFSPAKNPDMWSETLFRRMADNSRIGATCSTYSSAGFVKRNLDAAGFSVTKKPGYGRKREMITAVLNDKSKRLWRYRDKPWFALPQAYRRDRDSGPWSATEKKACVIGGGIAGLTTAYALVQRGWQVELIDKHGSPCEETSSNPSVVIYPRLSVDNDTDNAFYIAAYCHTLYQLKQLQRQSAEKFVFDTGLEHYLDTGRIEKIIRNYQLGPDFVSLRESVDDGESVVDYAGAGVLLPPVLCQSLQAACGHSLRITRAEIDMLNYHEDGWRCHAGEKLISRSPVLVIANGAGIARLKPGGGFSVDIVRGQIAILNANRHSDKIRKTINRKVHITPAIDGRHYLGASYQRGNDDGKVSLEDNRYLLDKIDAACPGCFTEADITGAWVGFRAIAKDRIPVVGAVADEVFYKQEYADAGDGNTRKPYRAAHHLPGLYVSAAHGSRGYTTAFISAEIIAALINSEPLPVSKKVMDYLNPSRFVMHDLKRG